MKRLFYSLICEFCLKFGGYLICISFVFFIWLLMVLLGLVYKNCFGKIYYYICDGKYI